MKQAILNRSCFASFLYSPQLSTYEKVSYETQPGANLSFKFREPPRLEQALYSFSQAFNSSLIFSSSPEA